MPRAPGRGRRKGGGGAEAVKEQPSVLVELLPYALLIAALVLSAAVRLRLAGVALERDEGEYAYAGRLILEGVPPYQLAYNMKPPGIYAAYAAIMALFGATPFGIRFGLLLVHSGSTVLLFLLGRRILDPMSGAIAGAAYALMATSPSFLGPFAHASHFIVLPVLAGLLLVRRAIASGSSRTLFLAGMLLGLALLMKQHAVFLLGFGAMDLLWAQAVAKSFRPARPAIAWSAFAAGAAVPGLATIGVLVAVGTFDRFWFWTVRYASEYVTQVPIGSAMRFFPGLASAAIGSSALVWLLAGIGLTAALLDRVLRHARSYLVLFSAASFLAVCPGFYFREHYFIVMLPAVALAAGAGACWIGRALFGRAGPLAAALAAAAVFAVAAAALLQGRADILFRLDTVQVSRRIYGANPFPEAMEIGRYLAAHTSPSDTIAVLGSEPEIYFYSGRHSATGYIYTYGLMEAQAFASRMQDEMISEIEAARPAYIVMVSVPVSWLVRKTSDRKILAWAERYVAERYDRVGVIDIISLTQTEYRWDDQASRYETQGGNSVTVYRRRAPATG